MASGSLSPSPRPLGVVRSALDRAQSDLASALERSRRELEERLAEVEQAAYRRERRMQALESYLIRIAAILAYPPGERPNWERIVERASDVADRLRTLDADLQSTRQARDAAESRLRQARASLEALSRAAARLNLGPSARAELEHTLQTISRRR